MILIATPTRDAMLAGTTGDLIRLIRRYPETAVRFMAPTGIYIGNLRESAVKVAQQTGASHILFIDADMRFPTDTLQRLLARNADIVGANYVQRTMPEWWVARRDNASISSIGRTGLEAVDFVGAGCLLIRRAVFDVLPRPWFDTPFDGETFVGEDVSFCRHARKHAYEVLIDHDLSQHVRHTTTLEQGVPIVAEAAVA